MVPMRTGWKNLCFTLCTTCKLYAVLFTASHSPKSSHMSRNLCVLWSLSTTGAWKIYTVCYMYGWSEIAKSKTEDNCRIWLVPCCPSVVQNRKVFPSAASFVFFFILCWEKGPTEQQEKSFTRDSLCGKIQTRKQNRWKVLCNLILWNLSTESRF